MSFIINPFTGQIDGIGSGSTPTTTSWKDPVANYSALPLVGNTAGDVRATLDTSTLYVWNGTTWISSSPNQYKVEKFTLLNGDIINKYVTLAATPTTASLVRLVIINGLEQDYSTDFTVSGNQVSWNGLGLDGVLEINEKIIVIYN